jgi:hypothetical protein
MGVIGILLVCKRDECLKGQDSDMEYADEHEKSEKDLKSGHSAGKGKEGGKLEWQTNKNQFSCLLAMLFLCRIMEVRIRD